MAACAYQYSNTTIRIDGSTCEFYLLDSAEYVQFVEVTTSETVGFGLPPLTPSEANELAAAAYVLWAVSYLWVKLQDVI